MFRFSDKLLLAVKHLFNKVEWTLFLLFLVVNAFWYLAIFTLNLPNKALTKSPILYLFVFIYSFFWISVVLINLYRTLIIFHYKKDINIETILKNRLLYLINIGEIIVFQIVLYLFFLYFDGSFEGLLITTTILFLLYHLVTLLLYIYFSKS